MAISVQLFPLPRKIVGTIQELGRSAFTVWPIQRSSTGFHPSSMRSDLSHCGGGPTLGRSYAPGKISGERICSSSFWGPKSLAARSPLNSQRFANAIKISRDSTPTQEQKEDGDENDPELCPVECVREVKSREEFDEIIRYAKEENALVVVDFFKTACGSCRYIEKGFTKLCMGAGDNDVTVIFLKHNVMDEYEEPSEFSEDLKIKVVPMFQFYKDGKLVESFATREKRKILDAISRHTGLDVKDTASRTA